MDLFFHHIFGLIHRFGVCCIFLVSTSGSTISQNSTYLRNPSFPSVYSSTSSLSYSVTKCSNGNSNKIMCQIHSLSVVPWFWTGFYSCCRNDYIISERMISYKINTEEYLLYIFLVGRRHVSHGRGYRPMSPNDTWGRGS